MSTEIMVDIEGMSLQPTAAITSIGAVRFDPEGDWIGDSFYIDISLADCIHRGMHIEAETIVWWIDTNDEARHALCIGQQDPAPLIVALDAFAAWLPDDATLWAKQASYDLAAIKHAYSIAGMATPWSHRKEVCMRRMLSQYSGEMPHNNGRLHHALDDAYYQAKLVQHINASR